MFIPDSRESNRKINKCSLDKSMYLTLKDLKKITFVDTVLTFVVFLD